MKTVASAYKAGVKFAYGTDAGVYPHGQNWEDFIYLVQDGLPPAYTLQMATINGAEPVSYTHLDVYKRQLMSWSGSPGTATTSAYLPAVTLPRSS